MLPQQTGRRTEELTEWSNSDDLISVRYQYTVMNLFSFPFILYWTEVCRSYLPLFTIINNNFILYQKNHLYFCCSLCILILRHYILLGHNYSVWKFRFPKSIFDMLKYFITDWLLNANFSKEIAKLFSRSAKTYANNSGSFSVHRI